METIRFRFPGQHQDEVILYVTRMHPIVLIKNIILVSLGFCVLAIFLSFTPALLPLALILVGFSLFLLILTTIFWLFALWWAFTVYRNTYLILTDRRVIKLGHTSPFTRYQSSVNLSEIQDSAATSRHLLEQLLNVGTFYIRSSAAAARDFWFEYLEYHIDLHNYLNKLLYVLRNEPNGAELLKNYRPFIAKPAGKRY